MTDYRYTILLTTGYALLVFLVPLVVIFLLERFYRSPIDPKDDEVLLGDDCPVTGGHELPEELRYKGDELPIPDLGPQSAAPSSVHRVETQARAATKELDNVYESNPPCPEFLARQAEEAQTYYDALQVEAKNPEVKAFVEKELRKALEDGTIQERVREELLEGSWEHPVDYRYVDARQFPDGLIFPGQAYLPSYVGPTSIPDDQISPANTPNLSPTSQEPSSPPEAS